ncbi:hypothetical protein MHYP_G00104960 [Metynnis hypsauchen]
MKIILILILYLISGPVNCFSVTAYSGSSVMIYCYHPENGMIKDYFWKETTKADAYAQTPNTQIHEDRRSLLHYPGVFAVIYRNLSLHDSGSYQCGEAGAWNHSVNLTVKGDRCCLGSNTVSGYLGETVTISCSYPEEFKRNMKFFSRWTGEYFAEVVYITETRRGRFSISDHRRSKTLSMSISDVKQDDGGVYYCGAGAEMDGVRHKSFFTEIQLQVSGEMH